MAYKTYNPDERNKLENNIDLTFFHTKAVLDNLTLFLYQPEEFNKKHHVVIPKIDLTDDSAYKHLLLVTYLHDFYKIISSPNHASLGYEFASEEIPRKLIQFHDIFGIINTGEASLLFLVQLFEYIRSLKANNNDVQEFLNKLFVLTVVDVASYGFLNQSRIDVFSYIVTQLKNSESFEQFEVNALRDTSNRIIRLFKANNRIEIPDNIESQISTILEDNEFFSLKNYLLSVRFDAGVYVLEPLFRPLLPQNREFCSRFSCFSIFTT